MSLREGRVSQGARDFGAGGALIYRVCVGGSGGGDGVLERFRTSFELDSLSGCDCPDGNSEEVRALL